MRAIWNHPLIKILLCYVLQCYRWALYYAMTEDFLSFNFILCYDWGSSSSKNLEVSNVSLFRSLHFGIFLICHCYYRISLKIHEVISHHHVVIDPPFINANHSHPVAPVVFKFSLWTFNCIVKNCIHCLGCLI